MTKPIIVVKVPCKLLYVIQVKEFLIKCSTSWPYLISEFLVAYITIVASDWPRTFFTPKVFLFSIRITTGLKNISTLEVFNIKDNNASEEAADAIATVLSQNTRLQRLHLSNSKFKTIGMIKIAKVLQNISTLTVLNISKNSIGEEAADDIASILSHNTEL